MPGDFVDDIEDWKSRSGTVKINLAIDRLPKFTADPGFDPQIHGGAIQILDDFNYLERAFQEARFGKAATLPFSNTAIPTVFDPTRIFHGELTVDQLDTTASARSSRTKRSPRGNRRKASDG